MSPGNRGQRSTSKTEEKHRRTTYDWLSTITSWDGWLNVDLDWFCCAFVDRLLLFSLFLRINVVAWTKLIVGHGPHNPFWKSNTGFNLTSMANHEKYVYSDSRSLKEPILHVFSIKIRSVRLTWGELYTKVSAFYWCWQSLKFSCRHSAPLPVWCVLKMSSSVINSQESLVSKLLCGWRTWVLNLKGLFNQKWLFCHHLLSLVIPNLAFFLRCNIK